MKTLERTVRHRDAEIELLRSELAKSQRFAQRYIYLRDGGNRPGEYEHWIAAYGAFLDIPTDTPLGIAAAIDEAVDAAMEASRG